jgi:hypothetical protein
VYAPEDVFKPITWHGITNNRGTKQVVVFSRPIKTNYWNFFQRHEHQYAKEWEQLGDGKTIPSVATACASIIMSGGSIEVRYLHHSCKISIGQNSKKKSRWQLLSARRSVNPSTPPIHSTGGSSFFGEFHISATNYWGSGSLLNSSKERAQSKPSSRVVIAELRNHFFVLGVSWSLSNLSTSLDSRDKDDRPGMYSEPELHVPNGEVVGVLSCCPYSCISEILRDSSLSSTNSTTASGTLKHP